jgi:sterol desaturase/sphingolipid hydroxylase (fatty acid hydroxylase superfamily)
MISLYIIVIGIIVIGMLVERMNPAASCPIRGVLFNVACFIPATILQGIMSSAVAVGVVMVTTRLGGGLVILPLEGWQLVPAIIAFTVVMDFSEYVFHRLQHRVPTLWAMHSFHHSDEAMNVSTTTRHFWAEQAIKAVTIYLLVGLLFQASPPVISAYGMISLCNFFFHMNVPVGFGRGWLLLNSPQYHRVHHSSLSEHQDRNFAALFPIFDAIFQTAHRPQPKEFPPTSLHDHDMPRSIIEAIIWPARGIYRGIRHQSLPLKVFTHVPR